MRRVELAPGDAVQAAAQAEVLARGRLAVGAAALGDHADRAPDRAGSVLTSWPATRALPESARASVVSDPHRRRLAGAVRAEQAEHGALLDGERQAVERAHVAGVVLDEAICLDRIRCSSAELLTYDLLRSS